jgi:hypothetical protein
MRFVIMGLLLVLAGCQGSGTGNSAGITYTMVGNLNIGAAAKDANEHCQRYGKVAVLNTAKNLIASFRCVEP